MPRREDVDVEQFRTKPAVPRSVPPEEGYASGAKPVKPADPREDFRLSCLAMRTGGRFYVPVQKFGGRLYDPLSDFQTYSKYEYRSVSEDAFNHYLNFLKTDNRSFYRQAERAI